ncbi:hypothetical protein [Actinacidiphila yeochonensis]|uniref:hypothetical protein n=1 Tax=Actinacidiphila yeochonensis TaxID=89050 RepID=UPI00056A3CE1|nr:hypothetical protein [Actinacidiphila yeochonensis]
MERRAQQVAAHVLAQVQGQFDAVAAHQGVRRDGQRPHRPPMAGLGECRPVGGGRPGRPLPPRRPQQHTHHGRRLPRIGTRGQRGRRRLPHLEHPVRGPQRQRRRRHRAAEGGERGDALLPDPAVGVERGQQGRQRGRGPVGALPVPGSPVVVAVPSALVVGGGHRTGVPVQEDDERRRIGLQRGEGGGAVLRRALRHDLPQGGEQPRDLLGTPAGHAAPTPTAPSRGVHGPRRALGTLPAPSAQHSASRLSARTLPHQHPAPHRPVQAASP